jgi:hypothetical protein
MNKKTQESSVKASRKAIQQQLIDELKKITSRFGSGSEKLIKEITKGSKKLAKIISKELKQAGPESTETVKDVKVVKKAEDVKKPAAPAPKEKSVKAAPPVKSAAAPAKSSAAPGKTVAKKAAPAPVQPKPAPVQSKAKPVKKVSAKPEAKKDNKTS